MCVLEFVVVVDLLLVALKKNYMGINTGKSKVTDITNRKVVSKTSFETKYLRNANGVTKIDRIRNEAIREELGVEPVLKLIEQSQLLWFGHVDRLHEERQVKRQTKADVE
nr:unnamed protein product [Callosobruchus analis]